MGIVEFVLERERRLGEKKGIAKGEKKGIEKERYERNYAFVTTLLVKTDFDDAKIATLASVTVEFVQNLRQENA